MKEGETWNACARPFLMEEHLQPHGGAAGKRETKEEENEFESPVVRSLSGKDQQRSDKETERRGRTVLESRCLSSP